MQNRIVKLFGQLFVFFPTQPRLGVA